MMGFTSPSPDGCMEIHPMNKYFFHCVKPLEKLLKKRYAGKLISQFKAVMEGAGDLFRGVIILLIVVLA